MMDGDVLAETLRNPNICDGQCFEKLDEIETMESKHNVFNAEATEQLCEADEAPIAA